MFIRGVRVRGIRYLQLVASYRRDGVPRHRILASLGRCGGSAREQEMREIIRDYKPLSRAQVVIADVEEAQGAIQQKGYFVRLRGWS